MKVTKTQINEFLGPKRLAIAGVSRNDKKFGNLVFKDLLKNQYDVLPVNPEAEVIDGVKCFKSIAELPADVESLLILTPKKQTDEVLRQAINKGIKHIWVQHQSETPQTVKIAEELNKAVILNKCIYMFAQPVVGFHKFHRTITGIFGGLPK